MIQREPSLSHWTAPETEAALSALQSRAGVSGLPRLLTLAILNSWV